MVYFQEEMIKDKRSALFILIVHFSDKSLSKGFNMDFSLQLSIFTLKCLLCFFSLLVNKKGFKTKQDKCYDNHYYKMVNV